MGSTSSVLRRGALASAALAMSGSVVAMSMLTERREAEDGPRVQVARADLPAAIPGMASTPEVAPVAPRPGLEPPDATPPSPRSMPTTTPTLPAGGPKRVARLTPVAPPMPPVKRPPPRPNRTSTSPDQPDQRTAPGGDPTSPPAARSTARFPQDFPDPHVLRFGTYWYAFSTQRGPSKVPVIRSTDLVHWEERGDALPALPRWSRFGAVWAPSVLVVPAGFVLYYTTPDAATGLQCLSTAVSALPDGPYVDTSSGPLVCQFDRGGSIDPSPFRDIDGRPWLTWKSEGTVDGEPTRIWSQPLSDDGRRLVGAPHELLWTAEPWEGPIIEAPSMLVHEGRYHLLYSGNRWETSAYATGHAVCDGPEGPCRRTASGSIVAAHPSEAGAGGAEVFRDLDGALRVAYHAWDPMAVGYPNGRRQLRIGALHLDGDGRGSIEPLPI